MPAVKEKHFAGAVGVSVPDKDGAELAAMLRAAIDDIAAIRTQFIAALAKLDADAGVTDTNYAATLTPAAQTLTKG